MVPNRAEALAPVFPFNPAIYTLARRVRGTALLLLGGAASWRRAAVRRGAARAYRLRREDGALKHRRRAYRALVSWRRCTVHL